MHDFVVREGKHEVLAERRRAANVKVMLVVETPVHGVHLRVTQRIVHPAHVPLKAEAETAEVVGRVTAGKAVDSSAIVMTPG